MPTILIVEKNGSIKETNVKTFVEDDLYKKAGFKTDKDFIHQNEWTLELNGVTFNIQVYGKKTGRAGQENKYEFPPPIDNTLFFGSVVILNMSETAELLSLTASEWDKIYESLYGGFEDIGDEDSESSDDDEDVDADLPRTKSGYAKDGFVVDDNSDGLVEDVDTEEDDHQDDEELEVEQEKVKVLPVKEKKAKAEKAVKPEKPDKHEKQEKPEKPVKAEKKPEKKTTKKTLFERIDTSEAMNEVIGLTCTDELEEEEYL